VAPDPPLSELYHLDETAWLERMSRLAAVRRHDEFDYENLSEYLSDMAKRDRRQVLNRLSTLLMHLLKWEHQPARRSNSWRRTIEGQRLRLKNIVDDSGTLRSHGREVLPTAYKQAVKLAAIEKGLSESAFPPDCPYTLEEALEKAIGGEPT
jgi:hypothetical protein